MSVLDEAFDIWNDMAARSGLPTVKVRTTTRGQALRRLLRTHGADGWRRICTAVGSTAFLVGENDRGWRADFDFVVKPSKSAKILEGGYGRAKSGSALPTAEVPELTWRRRIAYWHSSGKWDADSFGPAPGQPGCLAPAAMLRNVLQDEHDLPKALAS